MTSWDHDATGCELPDVCYTDVLQIPLPNRICIGITSGHIQLCVYVFCIQKRNVHTRKLSIGCQLLYMPRGYRRFYVCRLTRSDFVFCLQKRNVHARKLPIGSQQT